MSIIDAWNAASENASICLVVNHHGINSLVTVARRGSLFSALRVLAGHITDAELTSGGWQLCK